MVLGALSFGCFSILWTSLAFLLGAPPYGYGNAVIGLFGLAGLAGALAASVVGRMADRGHGSAASTASVFVMLASWAVLAAGRTSVVLLIIGIVALDLGVQGLHISNQSAIYALSAEARSRLTTAYMVSCFVGGAILSALSTSLYASAGWSGVCILGALTAAIALISWVVSFFALRAGAARRGELSVAEAD